MSWVVGVPEDAPASVERLWPGEAGVVAPLTAARGGGGVTAGKGLSAVVGRGGCGSGVGRGSVSCAESAVHAPRKLKERRMRRPRGEGCAP